MCEILNERLGNLWTSEEIVSFSKKTLLHEIQFCMRGFLYLLRGCIVLWIILSAGGITTRYGLGSPRIKSRCERYFPHPSRPTLVPTQPPIQWVLWSFPRRGFDHPPHLAPMLKKEQSYTSTPTRDLFYGELYLLPLPACIYWLLPLFVCLFQRNKQIFIFTVITTKVIKRY